MDADRKTALLLNLVDRLYFELGAHMAFLEWAKLVGEGEDIEGILAQCRADPALRGQADAYMQWLSARLDEPPDFDADQAYREFLVRWTPTGKPH